MAPVCDEDDEDDDEEAEEAEEEEEGATTDVVAVTCWPLDWVMTIVVGIKDVCC